MATKYSGRPPEQSPGFTIYGLHSGRDMHAWMVRAPIDFMVSARNSTAQTMGVHGVRRHVDALGHRVVPISIVISAKNETELRQRRREWSSWLSPMKDYSPLIIDTEPDKYYMAKRVEGSETLDSKIGQGYGDIEFVADDPHAYAVGEEPTFISKGVSREVYNQGLEVAYPLIFIRIKTGTFKSGTIRFKSKYDSTTVSTITLNLPDIMVGKAGDFIVIDTDDYTAQLVLQGDLSNSKNILPYMVSTKMPSLNPLSEYLVSAEDSYNEWPTGSVLEVHPKSRWL